jgi:hypothetical protein
MSSVLSNGSQADILGCMAGQNPRHHGRASTSVRLAPVDRFASIGCCREYVADVPEIAANSGMPVLSNASASMPSSGVGLDRGAERASNDADASYHSVQRVFPGTAGGLAFGAAPSQSVFGLSLLPACTIQHLDCFRRSCSWPLRFCSTAPGRGLDSAPPRWLGYPSPQGPSLGSRLFCPGPSSLSRPHPPHSPAHRDFTARRLIRDVFAVRERPGDPRVVPSFRCTFLPGMPLSLTPESSTPICHALAHQECY